MPLNNANLLFKFFYIKQKMAKLIVAMARTNSTVLRAYVLPVSINAQMSLLAVACQRHNSATALPIAMTKATRKYVRPTRVHLVVFNVPLANNAYRMRAYVTQRVTAQTAQTSQPHYVPHSLVQLINFVVARRVTA